MRGTQRVGSLLRLFLSAAFLCVAWILLSSTQADAAERPAPAELIASITKPVSASVPPAAPARAAGQPQVAAATLTKATVIKDAVAAVSRTPEPLLAPVVKQLRATTVSTVDAGAAGVKAVGTAVPALEGPVVAVVDHVVVLADAVPGVGREPLVDVSLPAAPVSSEVPELGAPEPEGTVDHPANLAATQGDAQPSAIPPVILRGLVVAWYDSDLTPTTTQTTAAGQGTLSESGTQDPSDGPEPRPAPQSPMPPTQSVPGPGGGAASADPASIGPAFVLSRTTTQRSSSSDWRVPRVLPAQPGTRPD